VLINVGSVGQPRDGDNRACYVIFDGKTVRFHRVAYDVRKTVDQLLQIEELPEYLAYRLREGR
jgi:diadenosine tetraphosphatase ApaH/serine/threonine PP2A family protein phosphatase